MQRRRGQLSWQAVIEELVSKNVKKRSSELCRSVCPVPKRVRSLITKPHFPIPRTPPPLLMLPVSQRSSTTATDRHNRSLHHLRCAPPSSHTFVHSQHLRLLCTVRAAMSVPTAILRSMRPLCRGASVLLLRSSRPQSIEAASALYLVPHRCMANREQKNKDKANMKKKQEKKQASAAASRSSSSSASADLSPALVSLIDTLDGKILHSQTILAQHLQELSITRLSPSVFDSLPIPLPAAHSTGASHSHSSHSSSSSPAPPLSQLASIASKSSHSLLLTPFNPQHIKHIEKALTTLRLPGQPQLTITADTSSGSGGGEQRLVVGWSKGGGSEAVDEMKKSVSKRSEDAKSAIRMHRQAALSGLKKADGSEEEKERAKQRLQAMVDEATSDIDKKVKDKEREIREA